VTEDDNPALAQAMLGMAQSLLARGRVAAARGWAERALALQRKRLRAGHPAIADGLEVLGTIALVDAPATAGPLFAEALAIRRKAFPAGHPRIARSESLLGAWLVAGSQHEEGIDLLRRGYATLVERLGPRHRDTLLARQRLRAAGGPANPNASATRAAVSSTHSRSVPP
jgi:hypothetical protein